jgi:cytochrome c oxidase cbb3-type subunit IV
MDVNVIRTLLMLACFFVFLGVAVWAYSGATKTRFSEAARVPLEDDEPARQSQRTLARRNA